MASLDERLKKASLKNKTEMISFRCPEDLKAWLSSLSVYTGVSVNQIIIECLRMAKESNN